MNGNASICQYLIDRPSAAGVRYCFDVPGHYVLGFYDRMVGSAPQHSGTPREDTAALAADGYARMRGLGALAATCGVGALNVVNANEVMIRHHRYPGVTLADFGRELAARVPARAAPLPGLVLGPIPPPDPQGDAPMTTARLAQRLNSALTPKFIGVADSGDSPCAATELRTHGRSEPLALACYTTLGLAVTGRARYAGRGPEPPRAERRRRWCLQGDRYRVIHARTARPGTHLRGLQQSRLRY
jgi:TPP-dependent 2-oxoacid decarboxylase